MAGALEVVGFLAEVGFGVVYALVVGKRSNFGKKEVEQEFGFEFADLGIEFLFDVLLDGGDGFGCFLFGELDGHLNKRDVIGNWIQNGF